LSDFAANSFLDILGYNRISIVVPGGTTPKLFYQILFNKKLNFSKVCFVLSDERLVHPSKKESNYGMLKKIIQSKVPKSYQPQIIPEMELFGNLSIDDFITHTNKILDGVMPVENAFLGIGEDGHTASLFPHHDLNVKEKYYYKVNFNEDFDRITLSINFLQNINNISFLVSGKSKQNAIDNIFSKAVIKSPSSQLINNSLGNINILSSNLIIMNEDSEKSINF